MLHSLDKYTFQVYVNDRGQARWTMMYDKFEIVNNMSLADFLAIRTWDGLEGPNGH